MLMRYYWGLGIGHVYSHGERQDIDEEMHVDEENQEEEDMNTEKTIPVGSIKGNVENEEENNSEDDGVDVDGLGLGLDDQEDDPWWNSGDSGDEFEGPEEEYSDDNELLEMEEMYS